MPLDIGLICIEISSEKILQHGYEGPKLSAFTLHSNSKLMVKHVTLKLFSKLNVKML